MNTSSGTVSERVIVAMSGGVDSSVAALLCVQDGSAVAGITLRLSDAPAEPGVAGGGAGRCCAVTDVADARRVASALGLPHWVLDKRERFQERVVEPFVREYMAGRTPVPCVACNDVVKFEDLAEHARALGAERVATGHYARIETAPDGRMRLLRARDRARDQSYFLHGLSQEQLRSACFPLGELTKAEVRERARRAGLGTADKPDSREICFVPDGDTGAFVGKQAAAMGLETRPGALVDREGHVRGSHAGVFHFTVGQRRGLGAHGEPVYALELRTATAEVVVGPQDALAMSVAHVPRFRWVSGEPPSRPVRARVQVRHGQRESVATLVTLPDGSVRAEFAEPERAVAPGQYLVAYGDDGGDECLGGGAIGSAERA